MQRPILIVLRGNSGSGKTTIAKTLHALFKESSLLISQDIVRREMIGTKDGADNPSVPLLQHLLSYGREHFKITILEGILRSEWYQPVFTTASELFSQESIHAYYFDISFEETVKRHQLRPQQLEFSSEKMKSWWLEQDLVPVLSETLLTKEMIEAEIIAKIQGDIAESEAEYCGTSL